MGGGGAPRRFILSIGEIVFYVVIGVTLIMCVGAGVAYIGLDEDDGELRTPPVDPGHEMCLQLLESLEVAEEVNHETYDRELFGDYDRDALLDESHWNHGAYVSRWDGKEYDDPSRVEVDHLVALAEAWSSGAHAWDEKKLERFGGDEHNLTLLTAEVNQEKSASDPAEWLPPRTDGETQESYAYRWMWVKNEYGLTIDVAEHDALLMLC